MGAPPDPPPPPPTASLDDLFGDLLPSGSPSPAPSPATPPAAASAEAVADPFADLLPPEPAPPHAPIAAREVVLERSPRLRPDLDSMPTVARVKVGESGSVAPNAPTAPVDARASFDSFDTYLAESAKLGAPPSPPRPLPSPATPAAGFRRRLSGDSGPVAPEGGAAAAPSGPITKRVNLFSDSRPLPAGPAARAPSPAGTFDPFAEGASTGALGAAVGPMPAAPAARPAGGTGGGSAFGALAPRGTPPPSAFGDDPSPPLLNRDLDLPPRELGGPAPQAPKGERADRDRRGERAAQDADDGGGTTRRRARGMGATTGPAGADASGSACAADASGSTRADGSGAVRGSSSGERRAKDDPALLAKYEKLRARVMEAPEDGDLRMRFASICADLGRSQEAIEHFRVAGKLMPGNGFIKIRLRELGDESAAKELSLESQRGPFLSMIPEAFAYPFRGNGLVILGIGSIFFGFLNGISAPFSPGGLLLRATTIGYVASVNFRAIQTVAQGKTEPPDWPDVSEAVNDFLRWLGAWLAAYGPAMVLGAFMILSFASSVRNAMGALDGGAAGVVAPDEGLSPAELAHANRLIAEGVPPKLAYDMARVESGGHTFDGEDAEGEAGPGGSRPPPPPPVPVPVPSFSTPWGAIILGLFAGLFALVGACYHPIALLMTATFNTSRPAFGYAFGIDSIRRLGFDYVAAVGVYLAGAVVVGTISGIVGFICGIIPIPILPGMVGAVVTTGLNLYLMLFLSYLLGRLYWHDQERLGWL